MRDHPAHSAVMMGGMWGAKVDRTRRQWDHDDDDDDDCDDDYDCDYDCDYDYDYDCDYDYDYDYHYECDCECDYDEFDGHYNGKAAPTKNDKLKWEKMMKILSIVYCIE